MDAWNPMESHFLSNWNLYQESGRNKGTAYLNGQLYMFSFIIGSRTSRGRDRPGKVEIGQL